MVSDCVVERSTEEWDVDGMGIEGSGVLARWAHAPSSWGMGRFSRGRRCLARVSVLRCAVVVGGTYEPWLEIEVGFALPCTGS